MEICSVVVWYNPNNDCVNNILTYSMYVSRVYIIDNSKTDNSSMASCIENSIYIPNLCNVGIARALNIGCQRALDDGFTLCLTMDQDSFWDATEFKKYIEIINDEKDELVISFAPNFKEIKSKKVHFHAASNEFPCSVITSGNVINLNIWNIVGRFYEDFFIDEVDKEFCYRLCENGFKIHYFDEVQMFHTLGEVRKHFFPKLSHSGVRLYYMVRNGMYIKDLHPSYFKSMKYRKLLSILIARILLEAIYRLKFKNIKYLTKAIIDYNHKKMGSYQS